MASLGFSLCPTPQIVTAHDAEQFVQWLSCNMIGVQGDSSSLDIKNVGHYRIVRFDTTGPMYPLCIGISTTYIPQTLIDEMTAKGCIQKSRKYGSITFDVMVEGTCVGEITFVLSRPT